MSGMGRFENLDGAVGGRGEARRGGETYTLILRRSLKYSMNEWKCRKDV
jgi:hypothetical protein